MDSDTLEAVAAQPPEQPAADLSGGVSWDMISQDVAQFGEYVAKQYAQGEKAILQNQEIFDHAVNVGGDYSQSKYDEIVKKYSGPDEKDIQDYENKWFVDPRLLVGRSVNQIPQIFHIFGAAASGGARGAAVGGTTGAVLAPFSEGVSIPSSIFAGAGLGARTGVFEFTVQQEIGNTYKTLRDAGVKHEVARPIATVTGAMSGVLDAVLVGRLTSIGKKAIIDAMRSPVGRKYAGSLMKNIYKNIPNGVKFLAKNGAIEMATEEGQTFLTDTVSIAAADAVDKLPNGENFDIEKHMRRAVNNAWETFKQALGPSFLLPPTFHIAGSTIGKAGKVITPKKDLGVSTSKRTASQAVSDSTPENSVELKESTIILGQAIKNGEITVEEATKFVVAALREGFTEQGPTSQDITDANNSSQDTLYGSIAGFGSARAENALSGTGDIATQIEDNTPVSITKDSAGQDIFNMTVNFNGKNPVVLSATTPVTASLENAIPSEPTVVATSAPEAPALKARLKKVQADISTLNGQIASQEGAFTKADKAGRATTAILNRLEKLYNAKELLEAEKYLLEQGDFTPSQLGNAKVQLTASQMLTARMKDLNRLVSNIKSAFARGGSATKRNIRDIQTEFISVIRTAPISSANKSKFITAVRSVNSDASLQKMLKETYSELTKVIDDEAAKEVRGAIDKLLNKTKLTTKAVKQGKFDAQTQVHLDAARAVIASRPAQRAEVFANVTAALDAAEAELKADGNDSPDVVEVMAKAFPDETSQAKAAAVLALHNYDNFNTDQLVEVFQDLQDTATNGRLSASQRLEERMQRKAEIETLVTDNLITRQPKMNKTLGGKVRSGLFKLWGLQESFKGLWNLVSPDDTNKELLDALDTLPAERAEHAGVSTSMQLLKDTLASTFNSIMPGFSELDITKIITSLRDVSDESWSSSKDGTVVNERLTMGQKLQLYMLYQDPSQHENLYFGNGIDLKSQPAHAVVADANGNFPGRRTLEDVIADIPDDVKLLGDSLLSFYDQYYSRINGFIKAEYGVSLPKNPNYSPAPKVGYEKNDGASIFKPTSAMERFFSFVPGATKTRSKNQLAIDLQDPITTVVGHIESFEHFIAWKQTLERIGWATLSPDTKQYVSKQYSPAIYSMLRDHYNTFLANRGNLNVDYLRSLNGLQQNFVRAKLGAKTVYQALTQFASAAAAFDYMDNIGDVGYAMKETAKDIKGTVDALWSSPVIQARYFNANRDMKDLVKSHVAEWLGNKRTLDNMLMLGLRVGDAGSVFIGGSLVYHSALKSGDTHEQALTKVERFVEETQQSGSLSQQSLLQKNFGFTGKILTTFLSGGNQALRASVQSFADLSNGKITAKEFAKKQMIYTVLMPVLFQAIYTGTPKEEKDWKDYLRAVLVNNMKHSFLFGGMIDYAWGQAINTLGDEEQAVEVFSPETEALTKEMLLQPSAFLAKLVELAGEVKDSGINSVASDTDYLLEVVESAAKGLDSPLGLPLETLYNIVKGTGEAVENKDLMTGALSVGGWPRSVVNKRLMELEGTTGTQASSESDSESPLMQLMKLFTGGDEAPPVDHQAEIKAGLEDAQKQVDDLIAPPEEDPQADTPTEEPTPDTPEVPPEIQYNIEIKDIQAENTDPEDSDEDVEEYAQ